MKVVYEESIVKRIQRAVYDADLANRQIGYIEVTVREANELTTDIRRTIFVPCDGTYLPYYTGFNAGKVVGRLHGVEIRVAKE